MDRLRAILKILKNNITTFIFFFIIYGTLISMVIGFCKMDLFFIGLVETLGVIQIILLILFYPDLELSGFSLFEMCKETFIDGHRYYISKDNKVYRDTGAAYGMFWEIIKKVIVCPFKLIGALIGAIICIFSNKMAEAVLNKDMDSDYLYKHQIIGLSVASVITIVLLIIALSS